jgi:hypothetical protein
MNKEIRMKTKFLLVSSLFLLVLVATACGAQAGTATPEAPGLPEAATPADSPSLPAVDLASLKEALSVAGGTVESGETIEQAFFTVEGQIIKVNGADVQVFEYETAEATEADAAQVADDGGSVGTSMISWMATPHFYKAGRILVIYVGDDQAILDLLEGILSPQFAGR